MPVSRIVSPVSVERATTPTLAGLRQARAQQVAIRRWFRLVLPALPVLVMAAGFHARPAPSLAGRGLAVSIGLAGFVIGLLGARWTLRRTGAVHVICAAVLVAGSVALMWAQPSGPGAVGVLVGVLFVAWLLPRRAGVGVSVVAFAVLAVIAGISGRGPGLPLLGVLGGFVGMAFLANRLGEANEQAEQLLVELEESRAAEARAAGLAERQRLAREMHDVLAQGPTFGCPAPGRAHASGSRSALPHRDGPVDRGRAWPAGWRSWPSPRGWCPRRRGAMRSPRVVADAGHPVIATCGCREPSAQLKRPSGARR